MNRTMNAARLNELANHPEVRPALLGADGPLDLTSLVTNPAVITLEAEHGAFLLIPILPAVYELHTLFLPEGRGKAFFRCAAEMFRYLFTRTDAVEIVTKVPDGNRGAALASTITGFRERFHRAGVSFRSLDIEGWALSDYVAEAAGNDFHEKLERAKEAAGSPLETHPHDATHDHIVGAAILMAHEGHLEKGVDFYCRWATFAGYATISIVGPNIVDVRDALIEIRDGQVGVLSCRSELPSLALVSSAQEPVI